MREIGNFFGTLTGVLFTLALLNYPIKWVNKRWINKLPKESPVRKLYTAIMRVIVQKHRIFGLGAAIVLVIHLLLQVKYKWISATGLLGAALLLGTVFIGADLFFRHRGSRGALLKLHRTAAALLLAAVAVHLLFRF